MTSEPSDTDPDPERPHWPNGPCPAWCDKFHEDEYGIEERAHFSEWIFEFTLTTEAAIASPGSSGESPRYAQPELTTYLKQHIREIGPRIVIDPLPKGCARLHLLPTEARQLGEALIHLSELATTEVKKSIDHRTRLSRHAGPT